MMIRKKVIIELENGLQGRSALKFISEANRFSSDIFFEKENKRLNAKSILGLMSMALSCGTEITLFADGPDEKKAVEALQVLISQEG